MQGTTALCSLRQTVHRFFQQIGFILGRQATGDILSPYQDILSKLPPNLRQGRCRSFDSETESGGRTPLATKEVTPQQEVILREQIAL